MVGCALVQQGRHRLPRRTNLPVRAGQRRIGRSVLQKGSALPPATNDEPCHLFVLHGQAAGDDPGPLASRTKGFTRSVLNGEVGCRGQEPRRSDRGVASALGVGILEEGRELEQPAWGSCGNGRVTVLIQRAESLLLQTRCKWDIPNEIRMERPKVALQAAVDLAKEICPDASFRSITNTYNCMGLVVATRRVWVDPEHVVKLLTDDGYRKRGRAEDADKGDVVVYHNEKGEPIHVGIAMWKNFAIAGENRDLLTVLSKWGGDGEYFHEASQVPEYLGQPAEYWTDRRTP